MKKINEIIASHFQIAEKDIVDTLTSKDIPNWDSMNYLLFIAELEKEYEISFTMDEVLSAQSVGEIKALLKKRDIAYE